MLGLRHRRKKLKSLREKGKFDEFIERENRVIHLLYSIGGLEIDSNLINHSKMITFDDIKLNPKYEEKRLKRLNESGLKEASSTQEELDTSIDDPQDKDFSVEDNTQNISSTLSYKSNEENEIEIKDKFKAEVPEVSKTPKKNKGNKVSNKSKTSAENEKSIELNHDSSSINETREIESSEDNTASSDEELECDETIQNESTSPLVKTENKKEVVDKSLSTKAKKHKRGKRAKKIHFSESKPSLNIKKIDLEQCLAEGKDEINLDTGEVSPDSNDEEDFFVRDSENSNKTSFFLGREGEDLDEDKNYRDRNNYDNNKNYGVNDDFDSSMYFRRKRFRGNDENSHYSNSNSRNAVFSKSKHRKLGNNTSQKERSYNNFKKDQNFSQSYKRYVCMYFFSKLSKEGNL